MDIVVQQFLLSLLSFIFFVFILQTQVLADSYENELRDFLINRTPTPAEDQSQDGLMITTEPQGEEKPNLYAIPRITGWAFEDHLFKKRKFDELIDFCQTVLKTSPDYLTYYKLAETYEINGEINKSIETYKKIIEAASNLFILRACYLKLWGIYTYDKKDTISAEEYLTKFNDIIISVEKNDASAKNQLAENLLEAGNYFLNESRQFDEAEKYFNMILKLNSIYSERANFNLVVCRVNKSIAAKNRVNFDKGLEELKIIGEKTEDKELSNFVKNLLEHYREVEKESFVK